MKQRQYIDFKLYLTAAPDGRGACQVALLPTPEVGETITPVTAPAEDAPPDDLLRQLANGKITLRNLASVGKKLADCLLPQDTIRERFRAAYDRAGTDGGVRLRLIIAHHALKAWPWEYVYCDWLGAPDSMDGFLALKERISLVRHEPLPHPHPAPGAALGDLGTVRMLVAGASPEVQGLARLDVAAEVGYITEAVRGFDLAGLRIEPEPLLDATPGQIADALLKKPYVFHFAGHGTSVTGRDDFNREPNKPQICLILAREGARDQFELMPAADVGRQLGEAGTRLAVLGACHSGQRDARYPWDDVAGALARAQIPTIIAMQYPVEEPAAQAFSRTFYTALGLGLGLDEAMWSGRVAMLRAAGSSVDTPATVQWGVPVLYSRLADGALFPERTAQATGSAEAFRKVISQTVTSIQKGELTGVDVKMIKNGVKVVQTLKTVTGHVTGLKTIETGDNVNIQVEQVIETVEKDAVIIGFQADEI